MFDLSSIIKEFSELRYDLENQIIQQLTTFVGKYGRPEENVVYFDLNPKEIEPLLDMPGTYVESDRLTGEMQYETLNGLYLSKAGDGLVRVNYSTPSYTDSACFLNTDTLIELHGLLLAVETGLEDVKIANHKLTPVMEG